MDNTSMDFTGLFDLDGSLANFDFAMRRDLSAMMAPCEPVLPVNLWDLEREPYIQARMHMIKSKPDWWLNLPRIENGFEILEAAREIGYQINILTKGPKKHPYGWAEKLKWCQMQPEILSDDGIHITMDKGLVYGRFLFDDYPEYMLRWLSARPRGLGIMPSTLQNTNFTHDRVVRWTGDNYGQVREALEIAFNRASREPLILPR